MLASLCNTLCLVSHEVRDPISLQWAWGGSRVLERCGGGVYLPWSGIPTPPQCQIGPVAARTKTEGRPGMTSTCVNRSVLKIRTVTPLWLAVSFQESARIRALGGRPVISTTSAARDRVAGPLQKFMQWSCAESIIIYEILVVRHCFHRDAPKSHQAEDATKVQTPPAEWR